MTENQYCGAGGGDGVTYRLTRRWLQMPYCIRIECAGEGL